MTVFETARFILREHTPEDAGVFYELNQDPEVIRYTGNSAFASLEAARAFLESYDEYRLHKMGRWAVISKQDGSYLGWCGLKLLPDSGDVDLGYRLARRHWGAGVATETARGSLRYGFETLGLTRITAYAATANGASIRVLEKLGLRRTGATRVGALDAVTFEILRDEWQRGDTMHVDTARLLAPNKMGG